MTRPAKAQDRGVVLVVVGLFWDFWLVLIGAFVFIAATQEERSTTVHQWLRGTRAADLMRRSVTTIDARQPAAEAAGWWSGPQVVTLDGRYYGLAGGTALSSAAPGALVADVTDRDAQLCPQLTTLAKPGWTTWSARAIRPSLSWTAPRWSAAPCSH